MSTLPDKWAVEITSLQDAERLQALFPDAISTNGISMPELIKEAISCYGFPVALVEHFTGLPQFNGWAYSPKDFYQPYGYTILTIDGLENLIK